ncbi:MAG: glycerol-3-phosphate 1-O-acyltransferase PlsY [Verrucomicrobiales bacterium]|nr:glycerol-3-phosphate 1-O-acyltransferase PlsY [Verrucomicrobiales bacterium]
MSESSEILSQWWPALLAYVVGATPFGFLAGKLKGIDIREHGSGNIGATNVLRTLGKPIGITVLVLDVFKGMIPVIIAKMMSDNSALHIATAITAILGHNYTFWLKFKGGKGIATTAGAVIPILTVPILVAIAVWVIFLKLTRYVSVASIAAAVAIPLTLSIQNLVSGQWEWVIFGFAVFVCLLAIWKHRANIQRLRRGEENRFAAKSSSSETSS